MITLQKIVCVFLIGTGGGISYGFIKQKVTPMVTPFSFTRVQQYSTLLKEPQLLNSFDNETLAYYAFVPSEPKGALVFYHGGGIWSNGIYQHMAQELSDVYHIAVYLFDIRGHGNSHGARGDAPTTTHVWRDIDVALDFVKKTHKIPLFLGGHSSGAGLVLNYAAHADNSNIAGYLFLSPFLGARVSANRVHADSSAQFVKKVNLWALILHDISGGRWFNNRPAVFFNYPAAFKKQDQHVLEYYTCAMAAATTPHDAQKNFAALKKPFGLLIGSEDEQFLPQETIAYKDYATQIKERSIAEIMPGETHLSAVIAAPRFIEKAINFILLRQNSSF